MKVGGAARAVCGHVTTIRGRGTALAAIVASQTINKKSQELAGGILTNGCLHVCGGNMDILKDLPIHDKDNFSRFSQGCFRVSTRIQSVKIQAADYSSWCGVSARR